MKRMHRDNRLIWAIEVCRISAGRGMTAGEIARAMDLRPSPYVRGLLAELVAAGKLFSVQVGYPSAVGFATVYGYPGFETVLSVMPGEFLAGRPA